MSKTDPQIEELLLDYLEGNLDGSKKALVERYLAQHPDMADELSAFNEIRLTPDEHLVYDRKESLKRTRSLNFPFMLRYAAAAGGAILIGLAMWLNAGSGVSEVNGIASNESRIEHTEEQNITSPANEATYEVIKNEQKPAELNPVVAQTQSSVSSTTNTGNFNTSPKKANTYKRTIEHATSSGEAVLAANVPQQPQREKYSVVLLENQMPASLSSVTEQVQPYFTSGNEVYFTENSTHKARKTIEELLPDNLKAMKQEVRKAIAENSVENLSGKVKAFFAKDKWKEALVPSLVQQDITSL